MVVNDNACLLAKRGAPESIASKLAPTKKNQHCAIARGFVVIDRFMEFL
ncbi:hypothetical protein PS938_05383 [Pseudomonas fluorescens]|uniref:Uncharacterized protein n=1 Tax=Pseudomonas fluorescens TaxID=294 RepID=A0A5E7VL42_PSEFL|nr:hypothetical protein PS938_05383 [Pseudomonas fluorescens]